MRKIHIDNSIYQYQVGKQYIKIKLPNGKSISPSISEITGVKSDDIERAKRKNGGFTVTHKK